MMQKRPTASCVLALLMLLSSAWIPAESGAADSPPRSGIPAEFRPLYSELERNLVEFDAKLDKRASGKKYPTLFGVEVIPADSLTRVTDASYYSDIVAPYLGGIQSLEAKVVKFQLGFPLLYQPFYRDHLGDQDGVQFQRRLSFYKRLVEDLHQRGMKVIIQAVIAPAKGGHYVADPLNLTAYYRSLSLDQYITGRAQNIVTIARELRPDYLNIEAEPDTEGPKTLRPELADPAVNLRLVRQILSALAAADIPGLHKSMLIAAGMGTWQRELDTVLKNYLGLREIDLIDIHIHTINRTPRADFLERALTMADAAHAAGKKVGADEEWFYKMSNAEFGQPPLNTAIRDHWSFWAPLDQLFLKVLVKFAHCEQLEYVSASGTNQMFVYLDYWNTPGCPTPPSTAATPAQWATAGNKALQGALGVHPLGLTETGKRYRELIAE